MKLNTVLFDLDGTIYRGNSAVEGAIEFIRLIGQAGIRYRFITNRSDRSSEEVASHLNRMGVICSPKFVITSAMASCLIVKDRRVAVIGSQNLIDTVRLGGAVITRHDPQDVLVGYDSKVDFGDIDFVCRAVLGGARFLATNGDVFINSNDGVSPEAGAILAAVKSIVSQTPVIVGKPGTTMIELALKETETEPNSAILVGDNLETDIAAANSAGLRSALILTGVTDEVTANSSLIKPTWCVKDYQELQKLVYSSGVSLP